MATGEVLLARPRGWRIRLVLLALLAAGWTVGILGLAYAAWRQMQQGVFPYWALPAGLLLLPLPWLFYALVLTWQTAYRVDAQGLHVRWGRHARTLPWSELLWMGPPKAYPVPLTLPRGPALVPTLRLGYTEDGRTVFVFTLGRGVLLVEGTHTGLWLLAPTPLEAFTAQVQAFLEGTQPAQTPAPPATTDEAQARPAAEPEAVEPETKAEPPVPEPKPAPPVEAEAPLPAVRETPPPAQAPASDESPLRSPWKHPLARPLLLANIGLGAAVFALWGLWAGRIPELQTLAPVLMAHGGFLGLEFALAFWTFTERPRLALVLWSGALLVNTFLLMLWMRYGLQ